MLLFFRDLFSNLDILLVLDFHRCILSPYFVEKLKNALRKFIIPVVYAAKNVHKVAPPHSYIDVRDFKSPKLLAEYLLYFNSNDTAYMSYLSWKKYYIVVKGSRSSTAVFCHLCNYLFKVNRPKVLGSYTRWFFKQSKCKNPYKDGLL